MPKKPTKATAREGQGAGNRLQSDEEILQERRRQTGFELADRYLEALSWLLWFTAAGWFFCFVSLAPVVPSLHEGACDPLLSLIAAGSLLKGMAKASPGGAWSAWRRPWQLLWGLALGLLAAAFGAACVSSRSGARGGFATKPPSKPAMVLAAVSGLGALAAPATLPAGSLKSANGSSAICARLLLAADGLLGMAVALSALTAVPWAEPLGPAAVAAAALPLAAGSLALVCCRSEGEQLAAVPVALGFQAVAAIRGAFISGPAAALLPATAALLHGALYLPLPLQEPASNPFHVALQRVVKRWVRLLTQPVSGFGDSSEG